MSRWTRRRALTHAVLEDSVLPSTIGLPSVLRTKRLLRTDTHRYGDCVPAARGRPVLLSLTAGQTSRSLSLTFMTQNSASLHPDWCIEGLQCQSVADVCRAGITSPESLLPDLPAKHMMVTLRLSYGGETKQQAGETMRHPVSSRTSL